MGLDAADPPGPRQLFLQRSIRVHASSFMQENMLGLQSLPPEQELVKRREAKRLEVQRRIEAERQAAAEKEQRRREEELRRTSSPTKSARNVSCFSRENTLQIYYMYVYVHVHVYTSRVA